MPSAAINAVDGGEAGLGWLVVGILAITALALGAAAYQRRGNKAQPANRARSIATVSAMSMHVQRACTGMLVALVAVLAFAAPRASAASHPFQTSLQDAAVFADNPNSVDVAMLRMRLAGASWVRIDLSWDDVAPNGSAKPAGFDPANPGDPQYRWHRVDWAVQRATAHGLKPLVNISEAPVWAERGHAGRPGTTNPDPVQLAAFARAAALRYSGRYAGLSHVPAWEVWNEVNASFFFMPQWKDKPGGEALSPWLYRRIVNDFEAAVHSVSPDDLIVAGSLTRSPSTGPACRRSRRFSSCGSCSA